MAFPFAVLQRFQGFDHMKTAPATTTHNHSALKQNFLQNLAVIYKRFKIMIFFFGQIIGLELILRAEVTISFIFICQFPPLS